MQAIKPYTQIFNDFDGQDILKKIELCGRVCYKSERKIAEGSAEKFVANIVKRGHEAVLEHGSFIVKTDFGFYAGTIYLINALEQEDSEFISYLRFTNDTDPIISGNVRAWREFFKAVMNMNNELPCIVEKFIKDNTLLFPEFQDVVFRDYVGDEEFEIIKPSDLKTENEKLTHQDVTVKFVTDRGVTHEIVRHRLASYCQESTRYCNYSKDDFGKEITFIIPSYLDYGTAGWNTWKETMKACEDAYFKLLDIGLLPQEARAVLPNSLKTELVMTANLSEWKHFFDLRTDNAAHPQMREVARPLLDEMKELIPGVFDNITH
jgi:thymidylate synthase (FAD)